MSKLTHGEMYFKRRNTIDFKQDTKNILSQLERLPKRMSRKDASMYYGDKIKKYFGVDDIKPKDFLKVEHYFNYYEAKRMLSAKS